MGKKHKKHHKGEKEPQEELDESSAERNSGPLKLVLRVGTPDTGASPASDAHEVERKHKHKKKKKKKSSDKDKERHHSEKKREWEHGGSEADNENDEKEEHDCKTPKQWTKQPSAKRALLSDESVPSPKKRSGDERASLQRCLDYLQKITQRKDVNGIFAFPVTDQIAPGYSNIIKDSMDFSTIRNKIDNNEYDSVSEYISDFKLMCNNCMTYNHPDTIYHKEGRKIWSIAHKLMSKERLLHMKRTLPFMAGITLKQLGIEDDESIMPSSGDGYSDKDSENQPLTAPLLGITPDTNTFEAMTTDDMNPEEILEQAKSAARHAAHMLTLRRPNSKFGFLRRKDNGTTTMTILNPDNDGIVSKKEKIVNLGTLAGPIKNGSANLPGFREDKRNRVTPVTYLNYGPFSSYCPIFDSTTANLSREDSDLLLSTYGDETGIQYSKSLQNFVWGADDVAVKMVDGLLDVLTHGEHSKTIKQLQEKELAQEDRKLGVDKQQQVKIESEDTIEDKENQPNGGEPPSPATTPVPNDKVDYAGLRSLSNLGIDVSFLDAFERPAQEGNPEFQKQLTESSDLIKKLEKTQYERLSQQPDPNVITVVQPSEQEKQLAEKVTKGLTDLAKQVTPGDVVSVKSVRDALGIDHEPDPTLEAQVEQQQQLQKQQEEEQQKQQLEQQQLQQQQLEQKQQQQLIQQQLLQQHQFIQQQQLLQQQIFQQQQQQQLQAASEQTANQTTDLITAAATAAVTTATAAVAAATEVTAAAMETIAQQQEVTQQQQIVEPQQMIVVQQPLSVEQQQQQEQQQAVQQLLNDSKEGAAMEQEEENPPAMVFGDDDDDNDMTDLGEFFQSMPAMASGVSDLNTESNQQLEDFDFT